MSLRAFEVGYGNIIDSKHRPSATVSDSIGVCSFVGHFWSLWSSARQTPSRLVTVSVCHTKTTNRTTRPHLENTKTLCFWGKWQTEILFEWSDSVRFLDIGPSDNRATGWFRIAFSESGAAIVQVLYEGLSRWGKHFLGFTILPNCFE